MADLNPLKKDRDIFLFSGAILAFVAYHFLVEEISHTGQLIATLWFIVIYLEAGVRRLRNWGDEADNRIWRLEQKIRELEAGK